MSSITVTFSPPLPTLILQFGRPTDPQKTRIHLQAPTTWRLRRKRPCPCAHTVLHLVTTLTGMATRIIKAVADGGATRNNYEGSRSGGFKNRVGLFVTLDTRLTLDPSGVGTGTRPLSPQPPGCWGLEVDTCLLWVSWVAKLENQGKKWRQLRVCNRLDNGVAMPVKNDGEGHQEQEAWWKKYDLYKQVLTSTFPHQYVFGRIHQTGMFSSLRR
ncbi:hypothetical protein ACOSQ3_017877 [Xanthoceras sorbifolium]